MNIEIRENHEFRFETNENPVKIKIISGHCEIKGEELLINKTYEFKNTKSFIFAHTTTNIVVDGKIAAHYITDNSNIPQILRLFRICLSHDVIPNFKYDSVNIKEKIQKNRFIVLGNGKSTFIHTITNYLVRMNKKVLVTELSPKTGYLVFPGCLATTLCTNIRSCVNENFSDDDMLVYFYGSTDLSYNSKYYERICRNLDEVISQKPFDYHFILANEQITKTIEKYEAFKDCLFIALKDEKLYSLLPQEKIFIAHGAYEQKIPINSYFNTKANTYNIKLWSKVVRIGEEFVAPDSALPIGAERKIDAEIVSEVSPIKNRILGASFAENEEEVMDLPVKSFVVVSDVGENFVKVQCLQPSLKPSFLIQGEIEL